MLRFFSSGSSSDNFSSVDSVRSIFIVAFVTCHRYTTTEVLIGLFISGFGGRLTIGRNLMPISRRRITDEASDNDREIDKHCECI